ncbi:MAG: EAL domain-containing protein, partial [Actinomycetota bacterium]|nr:EAL domain-containing protein [Actinomycetota bacterium]
MKSRFDVLVVEDNPGDSFLLAQSLQGARDDWEFEVAVVETLAAALERLVARRPDVVMLDLQLPDARRLEGLARLRDAAPDVPVVVLTGNREAGLGERAVLAGAQDYVRKADMTGHHVPRVLAYAIHRKAAAQAVRAAEERFGSLLQGVNDIVALHGADGGLRYASPSAGRLLGLAPGETLPEDGIERRVHPDDRERVAATFRSWLAGGTEPVQFRLLTAAGEWLHCEAVGSNRLADPTVQGVVVTTRDISDRKRAEAELAYQAVHDGMTGLPNRTLFFDRLDHALARRTRTGSCVAVFFIDVDHFKAINDSRGHKVGDEMLLTVARALSDAVRPGDTVARLGGDEFAVLCEDIDSPEAALHASERLLRAASGKHTILGKEVHVSLSVGVAVVTGSDATADGVLRDADAALYRAKDRGRGCVEVFDDDLRAATDRRLQLEEALPTALSAGTMQVHYQPQVEIATGRLIGMEALLRWTHPELGNVSPGEFVPIAEQMGMIGALGAWVLRQACEQLVDWRTRHPDVPVEVAVNVSGRQLSDPVLLEELLDVLRTSAVEPGRLCLEITETVVMEDAATSVATLRSLRELGVRLAIDDFGTGYSSLAYLKRFPVDLLKVDRAFIAGLGQDPEDSVIVASIVQLASSLGVEVMAEGVENEHQLHEVAGLGCRYGQGFFWGRPQHPSDLDAVFEAGRQGSIARGQAHRATAGEKPDAPVEDVVSVLAHELRTPITVIRGFAETLAELLVSGRTEVLESAIEAINRQTHGMETMLASLAEMRAVDEGTLRLSVEDRALGEMVRETVNDVAVAVPGHKIEVEGDIDTLVPVDPARFRQMLVNLVTNAAKWSPPGSPISVRIDHEESSAFVRVIDCGPGIPIDRAGEIFRKFSRLDTSRKGTGLGLYLSRSFARAHGGDVYYRRAASTGGAEFVIVLPLARGTATSGENGQGTRVEMAVGAPGTAHSDSEALGRLHAATRALLRATSTEEVVGIAIALVRNLGGEIALGPGSVLEQALPVDLSFGVGVPVHPCAAPGTEPHDRLHDLLPAFVEDARRVVPVACVPDGPDADAEPLTGLPGRAAVLEALAAGPGSLLLVAPGDSVGTDAEESLRTLA